MQVILLHPRFTRAKSLTLGRRHWLMLFAAFSLAVLLVSGLLYLLAFQYAASMPSFMRNQLSVNHVDSAQNKEKYLKENLAAMAIKLGQMQAQLMRLDALGERVQGLAGIKPEEFNFKELPGRGGAEPSSLSDRQSHDLSMVDFQQALAVLSRDIGYRA
ncbi:MAG: M23 family peptidase, partial [Glaciimonas sp.]|nr:M23 family peptidase [Glaciimonas sp.]